MDVRFPFSHVLLLSLLPVIPAKDSLLPGAAINGSQTLVSAGGTFALGFFNPGGTTRSYLGIWYNNIPNQTVVWVANRERPAIGRAAGISLTLTNSGELVVTNEGLLLWSSGVMNLSSPMARITDDGNFGVIEESSMTYAWQSFEHPTDTILPEMKIMVSRRTGKGTVLRSWRNATDPAPGDYTYAVTIRGYEQAIFDYKSIIQWRSGLIVGWYWSDAPGTGPVSDSVFSYVRTEAETYYFLRVNNKSTLARVVMSYTGQQQGWKWSAADGWINDGHLPRDRCDYYGKCGAYSVCTADACECLQGFVPSSPGNRTAGCVRRTALDCRVEGTTDGFVRVSGLKMPDSAPPVDVVEITGWGAVTRCKDACVSNCSCTGYAPASDGSSCLMWFGDLLDLGRPVLGEQDLFVRVAAADLVYNYRRSSRLRRTFAIAGTAVGVFVLGAALAILLVCYLIKERRSRASTNVKFALEDSELCLLDFATLSAATNNFSDKNVLGEGGFGTVFKGKLEEEQEVAVKRLSWDSKQGLDEFKTEAVLIAKLQHKNLVKLLGCCIHENEKMLIYEYMHNKSLDHFLFDKTKSVLLDWPTRFRIIQGVAKGLMYLHHDSRVTIIHRDLKTSNVLLDANMEPKISDFGMARIFAGDQGQAKTKRVVGTYGYMSPEYALDGVFSVKSDVFSFGVITLEIVSGLKSKAVLHADPRENLLGNAWNLWKEDKLLELLDPTIRPSVSLPEALICTNIGLLCVQQRSDDRPLMSSVVSMLGNTSSETLPKPKEPGFIAFKKTDPTLCSEEEKVSINCTGITIMEGR